MKYYKDDLKDSNWLGEVVDTEDPKELGRVKVKVFGKFDDLENEFIPWARPSNGYSAGSESGTGFFSIPKVGSIVNVNFDNGNLYAPEYTFIQKISDELKAEIEGDNYQTAQSLIYDTDIEGGLKIFYTEERGLMIKLGETMLNFSRDKKITITNKSDDDYSDSNGNSIVIDPEGNLNIDMDKDLTINIAGKSDINIEGNSTMKSPKIHLNSPTVHLGENAIEQVIKGNTFQTLFNAHTHIGNFGAPTSQPIVQLSGSELSQVTKTQ